MSKKYYVYRFIDFENDIIYVGKTNSIKTRIGQHFGGYGHLPPKCYEKTNTIQYVEFTQRAEMDIYELYYINKFKPKYNTVDKYSGALTIDLEDKNWKVYETKNSRNKIDSLEKELLNLKSRYKRTLALNEVLITQNNDKEIKKSFKNESCLLKGIGYKDIIRIYNYCESESIVFNSVIQNNGEIINDFEISLKDEVIYIEDLKEQDTNSLMYGPKEVCHLGEKNVNLTTLTAMSLSYNYIPNIDLGYRVLEKILEVEAEQHYKNGKKEYKVDEVLELGGQFVDILSGLRYSVTEDGKIFKECDFTKALSKELFKSDFKGSIFKNARWRGELARCEKLKSEISEYKDITI